MKHNAFLLIIISLFLFLSSAVYTQQNEKIAGIWEGKLNIQGMELRLVFNISSEGDGLEGTIDSPDQGAKGIPVGKITIYGDSITITVPSILGTYIGKVDYDALSIYGTWTQSGMGLPLDLKKTDKVTEIIRPQTPKEPFPYEIKELNFFNEKDSITLAGTLTIPDNVLNPPVVILVSGSGPQDRDETLLSHKPFRVIADVLSRNGIAVLRYDDRGTASSEGDFSSATTNDFVEDAVSAVKFIANHEKFNDSKIGIIGHSEGGLVAPLAALRNDNIDFIVLLAGPAITGEEILLLQSRLIAMAEGAEEVALERDLALSEEIYSILKTEKDTAVINKKVTELVKEYYEILSDDEKAQAGDIDVMLPMQLQVLNSPWFRFFLVYDPRPVLEQIKIPVLALYGEKDLQVPPGENIEAIKKALADNNPKNKILEMQGLNHLFQTAETGSPTEYGKIEETFSTRALKEIVDWIYKL